MFLLLARLWSILSHYCEQGKWWNGQATLTACKERVKDEASRQGDYMLCAIYCQLPKTIKLTLMATTWPLMASEPIWSRSGWFYDLIHWQTSIHLATKCQRARTRLIKFRDGKVWVKRQVRAYRKRRGVLWSLAADLMPTLSRWVKQPHFLWSTFWENNI